MADSNTPTANITTSIDAARRRPEAQNTQVLHDRSRVTLVPHPQGGLAIGDAGAKGGRSVASRLTRAAAESIIRSGKSIVWDGQIIETVDQLPPPAQMITDPAQRKAEADRLDQQAEAIKAQSDDLRKAPAQANVPPAAASKR